MATYNKDFIVKNGLQVGANTTITGSLTASGLAYPVSDGSANQYLKTDGSGNLSWGTVNVNNITGNLSVSGDITSGGKVLFANVYSALSDLPSASTYHGMFAHVHATGKGYYAHAGNWVELANNSDLYTDAQAVSAVQSATNLTIDGGTIYVDTANDRVGIGDTSPQYMLDVGGTSGTGSIAVAGTEVIDSSAEVITARLKNSGVSAGSYTAADITVDAKGRVTSAASTPIGGSLTGSLANLKLQYGSTYSGTPVQGSFFFDSLNQKLKVYTGSTFVDAVPAGGGGGGGGGSSDANSTFRSYTYTLGSTTNSIQGVDDRTITAGDFVSGHKYTIVSVGTTDFTAIGASANTVGVVFTSTGAGSGTGTASPTLFYDTTSNSTTIVVYVNGVKQVYGSSNDFVATTGTSVAFTYNITSGSVVDVQVYELLTNAAYYLKSETYSQTQVSNGFLSLAGGTMTGRPVLNYNNPEIRFEDTDTSNNGEITLDNTSLRFESDPDNAVADSTIKFMVDGDTKAIINDSGKVGIGTASPNAPLDIKVPSSSGALTDAFLIRDSSNYIGIAMYAGAADGEIRVGAAGQLRGRYAAQYAGTRSAHSFTIGTNNTTAISIDDAQNTAVLISDSNTTQATLKGLVISNSDGTTNNGSAISFAYGSNGNSFSKIGVINTDRTGSSEDQDIFFANLGGGSYSESMRIKSNGSVGIGTTSPDHTLVVGNNSTYHTLKVQGSGANLAATVKLKHHGGGGRTGIDPEWNISRGSDQTSFNTGVTAGNGLVGGLAFWNNTVGGGNVDAMRLKDNGDGIFGYNVGIGTTSPSAKLHTKETTSNTISAATAGVKFDGSGNDGLAFGNMASSPYTSWIQAGYLQDGYSPAFNNGYPIALNPVGGGVGIGTTSPGSLQNSSSGKGWSWTGSYMVCSGENDTSAIFRRNGTTGNIIQFRYSTSGNVGTIDVNSSSTTYNTTSDRRLKENIELIADGKEKLLAMKPSTFNFIADENKTKMHGFIAQEMQDIVPEAVSGDSESENMMSMDYGRITPVIVAALQDALKEIEELKTRINELENK